MNLCPGSRLLDWKGSEIIAGSKFLEFQSLDYAGPTTFGDPKICLRLLWTMLDLRLLRIWSFLNQRPFWIENSPSQVL